MPVRLGVMLTLPYFVASERCLTKLCKNHLSVLHNSGLTQTEAQKHENVKEGQRGDGQKTEPRVSCILLSISNRR